MFFKEIELLGLLILEPGTLISDLLMGAFCIFFFLKLLGQKRDETHKHFPLFFMFLGFSAIISGFAHALYYCFGSYLHNFSWILSGLAVYFLQLGTINIIENNKFKAGYLVFIKMQFLIYLIALFTISGFLVVKINFVIALIGIISPMFFIDYLKKGHRKNLLILIGVFLAIIPSIYHSVELEFAYIFNMNDISHFFLIGCIYFVYLGIENRFFQEDIGEI